MSIKTDIIDKLGLSGWRDIYYQQYLETRINDGWIQYRIDGDWPWINAVEVDEAALLQDIQDRFGVDASREGQINTYIQVKYDGASFDYRLIGVAEWEDSGDIADIPPTAVAGPDQDLPDGDTETTLTGSGISGTNPIVSYLWEQISGPGTAVIVAPNAAITLVQGMLTGNTVFRLTVTDSIGLTGQDSVSIMVDAVVPASFELLTDPWTGAQLGYIFKPAGYTDDGPPVPGRVYCNGGGENGSDPTLLVTLGPFANLCAEGLEYQSLIIFYQSLSGWTDPLVLAAYNYMINNYNVDVTMIYGDGASSGAAAVVNFHASNPGKFAAVFACGLPGTNAIDTNAAAYTNFPLRLLHGMADAVVDVQNPANDSDAINATGPMIPAELRTVAGGTHSRDTWNPYGWDYRTAGYNIETDWMYLHSTDIEVTAENYVNRAYEIVGVTVDKVSYYLKARNVVSLLTAGEVKTQLTSALDAMEDEMNGAADIIIVDLGIATYPAGTNQNKISAQVNGANSGALVTLAGVTTGISFVQVVSQWAESGDLSIVGRHFGLINYRDGFRVEGTANEWQFTGITGTCDLGVFYGSRRAINSVLPSMAVSFGGQTINSVDDSYNTTNRIVFSDKAHTGGILSLQPDALTGQFAIINNLILIQKGGEGPGEPEPSLENPEAADFVPLRTFTITPDADARNEINGSSYLPGDLILLSGTFKYISFTNLNGAEGNPIVIQNKPGEVVNIGDQTWSGGSWAGSLAILNCHHFIIWGTNVGSLIVDGSTSDLAPGGNAVRAAYFNFSLNNYSDNFRICYLTVRNGGTGIWCKKEVVGSDPNSFGSNTLDNIEFDHNYIHDTWNEGMYLGHSATFWNINTNAPLYPNTWDPTPDPAIYKVPIRINNLKVHHNLVRRTGADGIQIANCDNIEINNNEVDDAATRHDVSHNGGIIVGGVTGHSIHDNYIHNCWGELIQMYAKGAGTIHNNLLVGGQHNGIGLRTTNNAIQTITNNTIAVISEQSIRVNGHYNGNIPADPAQSPHILQRNILADPLNASSYIYLENEGKVTEGTATDANVKQLTLAGLDTENWYLPASGTAGYRHTSEIGIPI